MCADSFATGIGVNLPARSRRVAVFLMAGGACGDDATYYRDRTATNIAGGYGAGRFAGDIVIGSFFGIPGADVVRGLGALAAATCAASSCATGSHRWKPTTRRGQASSRRRRRLPLSHRLLLRAR